MLTPAALFTSALLLLATTQAANIDRLRAIGRRSHHLVAREGAPLVVDLDPTSSLTSSSSIQTSSPSSSVLRTAWNSTLAGTGYHTGGTASRTGGSGVLVTSTQSPKTTGVLDGAPWLSPTSFCDFGSVTYSTVSQPATITDTAQLCVYTSLSPNATIHPNTTSSVPTDRPAVRGLSSCAAVVFGPAHQECPYGTDGWCNCGGTLVAPLPATEYGMINCAITKQPTANSCPVNTAYSQSLVSAASVSSANAKATPNTKVSSFACPTNAVVGGPDGLGPGHSNQETLSTKKQRQQLLASISNSWGCNMPVVAHNDFAAEKMCSDIPDNTVLSLGLGKQPFHMSSRNQTADDPTCPKKSYNMAFTVKDKCEVALTKEYCLGMYQNIKKSCGLIVPDDVAVWEGGLVTDNCGVAYFTYGHDITEPTSSNHDPFYDLTQSYWWDTNHLLCGPSGANDPTYCPKPLPGSTKS